MLFPPLRHITTGLIALASLSCDAGRPVPEVELVERAVRRELVPLLPVARVERTLTRLDFDRPEERRLLSAGWGPSGRDERGGFAWTQGRDAVIEVPIVRTQSRRLQLDLEWPLGIKALPEQKVHILWNGQGLGTVPLPQGTIKRFVVEVPAELQRVGPNRVDILPAYWLDLKTEGGGRKAGVRVRVLRLGEPAPAAGGPSSAANAAGDALLQAPGSVISFALHVPREPHFLADLSLEGTGRPGELQLTALTERGEERTLGRWSREELASNPALDVAFEDLGDRLLVLNLAYSSESKDTAPWLRWSKPRIEGTQIEPPAPPVPDWRGSYNVLIVLFDTLRADYTQPYGAVDVQTPALAKLSRRGVTFTDATTNASWTRPSVASLLTAQRPSVHSVTHMAAALPKAVPYLPAVLGRAGYATLGLVNNPQVSQKSGFARGFDTLVDDRVLSPIKEQARTPQQHAERIWEEHVAPFLESSGERPFFIYLHEIDPHSPYEPLPGYDTLYDFGYQGNVSSRGDHLLDQLRVLSLLDRGADWLGDADLRHLRSQYAGEVSAADAFLGWLLERLRSEKLTENTLVVFVSDHGEELLEHDQWGHGNNVYQTVLHVPMIFSLPGVLPEGRRPQAPVQLHDVAPTILDLVGVPIPPEMQGQSLLPHIARPEEERPDRVILSRSLLKTHQDGHWNASFALRFRNWKLIRRDHGQRRHVDHEFELYDLDRDPLEQLDRWPSEPVVGLALQQMLAESLRNDAQRSRVKRRKVEPDPATSEALRELGYAE